MATNTGSNGGKNNTGYMRGPGNVDQSSGIGSALNQGAYRKEYNDKMFSDNGYLNSSIKDLKAQADALDDIIKKSKQLTQAEKNRFSKMSSDMKKMAAEQEEMFSKQEASAKELQSSLNKSSSARLKSVDELYRHFMKKEKELGELGKRQIDAKIREFAARTREIKAETEDINEATEAFNKAQKSFKQGLGESIKNITDSAMKVANMINIQSLANNEFAQKANERYEVMNNLNRSLGFNLAAGTNAYNSITSEFKAFNNNVGNLFNVDDMRGFMKEAANMGLTNEKALRDSMEQGVIANKLSGLSYETQASMYKYMKMTNNNDSIANYNKMMVSLTKANIGVSKDMLDQLIRNGQDVNEVLVASGVDMAKYNEGKAMTMASLQARGIDAATAKAMVESVDAAIQNLYNQEYDALAKKKIDPMSLNRMISGLSTGATSFEDLYNYTNSGTNSMSAVGRGVNNDVFRAGAMNNPLGITAQQSNYAALGVSTNIDDNLEELKKHYENTSAEEAKNYLAQNQAISDLTKLSNKNSMFLEDTFGNGSWLNYENLAKTFFTIAIAGQAFQVIGGIGKGISGLVKFFSAGAGTKGLAAMLGIGGAGAGAGAGAGVVGAIGAIAAPVAAIVGIVGAIYALDKAAAAKNVEGNNGYSNTVGNKLESKINQQKYAGVKESEIDKDKLMMEALNEGQERGNVGGIVNSTEVRLGRDKNGNWKTTGAKTWDFTNNILSYYSGMSGDDRSNAGLRKNFFKAGSDEAKSSLDYYFKHNNARAYNKIKSLALLNLINNNKDSIRMSDVAAALNVYLLYANRLQDTPMIDSLKEDLGIEVKSNKEEIKKMLKSYGITSYSTLEDIYSLFRSKNVDYYLLDSTNHFIGYPSDSEQIKKDMGLDGYHKAGLNYVPKENYKALLHQGEMVLNKQDADVYRAMMLKQDVPQGAKNYIRRTKLDEIGNYQGGMSDSLYKSQKGRIVSGLKWTMTAGWPAYPSGGQHRGLDFGIPEGTEIGAAFPGVVDSVDTSTRTNTYKAGIKSYGMYVRIKGDNGKYFRYGHLSGINVSKGQRVNAGDLIGLSGNTGYSTGPHLHYQVDNSASYKDDISPYDYITESLWNIGDRSGSLVRVSDSGENSGSSGEYSVAKLATINTTGTRAIPGMGGVDSNLNGPSSTDRIVSSVDGVSTKIIKYLDEIRQEQADQRRLINAFSASQSTIERY